VPHGHPLHTDVDAECYCCRALQPFRFSSPSDQVVCAFCSRHVGDGKAERRDLDHLKMWAERYADLSEEHRRTVDEAGAAAAASVRDIAKLTREVAGLRDVIAGRFEAAQLDEAQFDEAQRGSIRSLLQNEIQRRAERNTELANRRSDRLMAVIWRLDVLHRDDNTAERCVCGRPTAACLEWKAIEPERRLLREWEAKNLALLGQARRHALPDDHPAVLSARA
jgi:hypothetical protein